MYTKVFTSLWNGSLRGQPVKQLVFIYLLAMADPEGVVDVIQSKISDDTGLSPEEVSAALEDLEAVDPESRSDAEDGRRVVRLDEHRSWGWRIVNHEYYTSLRNEDERRERNREAQRKHRQQMSSDVSNGHQESPMSAHVDVDVHADVEKSKEESKAADQEKVKESSREGAKKLAAAVAGEHSLTPPIREKSDDAKEVWDLIRDEPEAFQRTCMAVVGRLLKAGERPAVARACVEHYLSHRETIVSPYAYYSAGGEGLDWVKHKSRLAASDTAWAAEKKQAEEDAR